MNATERVREESKTMSDAEYDAEMRAMYLKLAEFEVKDRMRRIGRPSKAKIQAMAVEMLAEQYNRSAGLKEAQARRKAQAPAPHYPHDPSVRNAHHIAVSMLDALLNAGTEVKGFWGEWEGDVYANDTAEESGFILAFNTLVLMEGDDDYDDEDGHPPTYFVTVERYRG